MDSNYISYYILIIITMTIETCVRRAFTTHLKARKACLQLEKCALKGLYSCIYDDRRVLSMFDKVEQCLRAKPVIHFSEVCNCRLWDPRTEEGLANVRWEQKAYQDSVEKQRDDCCCRQIEYHYELIGWLFSEPATTICCYWMLWPEPGRVKFLADIHIVTPIHRSPLSG